MLQRLVGLEEGWQELHRMWENRQHMLSQGLNLQVSHLLFPWWAYKQG